MPRQLTDHIASPANEALKIEVLDTPGQGGACHVYRVSGMDLVKNPSYDDGAVEYDGPDDAQWVMFQNGPIKEFGVNGTTQEVLLAIIIDRLASFQAGPFACMTNELALLKCREALDALKSRTRERIARGVEGTNRQ